MILYSLGSAGALAYFCAGWGAAYYLIDLVALFTIVLVLMKRYSQRLLLSYSITFGLGLFAAITVPNLSPHYLTTGTVIPVVIVFAILCAAEVFRAQITARSKTILTATFLAIVVAGIAVFAIFGDLTVIAGKFISVLDPFQRASQPLIESVAEHRITAWGSIYYELGIGILFFLSGLYFTLKNPTNRNVFLLLFGITALYFASSMVRLLVLLAPAFALLLSIGVIGLLKPFYSLLKESSGQVTVKSKRNLRRVGKEFSAIAIILIATLLISNYAFSVSTGGEPRVYGSVYTPITISSASLPISQPAEQIPYWLNMMDYTRTNLDSSTVVSSWWDYGNWLGIIGNVTTLCDNTTVNGTQIENVGYSMVANETQSIKMLKEYNAKFVLVFVVLKFETSSNNALTGNVTFAGYGDEGKWMWMARISGGAETRFRGSGYMNDQYSWTNEEAFGNYTTSSSGTQSWTWNDMGTNSTIYKMMSYAEQKWAAANGFTTIETKANPSFFKEAYIAGADITYTQAAQQYGGLIPLVCLFEIDYDAYNNATATITP
jgi:dolichyl-diphosphooligosaccharide--protein glycosyltransferase